MMQFSGAGMPGGSPSSKQTLFFNSSFKLLEYVTPKEPPESSGQCGIKSFLCATFEDGNQLCTDEGWKRRDEGRVDKLCFHSWARSWFRWRRCVEVWEVVG